MWEAVLFREADAMAADAMKTGVAQGTAPGLGKVKGHVPYEQRHAAPYA